MGQHPSRLPPGPESPLRVFLTLVVAAILVAPAPAPGLGTHTAIAPTVVQGPTIAQTPVQAALQVEVIATQGHFQAAAIVRAASALRGRTHVASTMQAPMPAAPPAMQGHMHAVQAATPPALSAIQGCVQVVQAGLETTQASFHPI